MKKDELHDENDLFCGRCKEESFPVALVGFQIRMGQLYKMEKMPKKIKRGYEQWYYLCGNCYFDLMDEFDEREGR